MDDNDSAQTIFELPENAEEESEAASDGGDSSSGSEEDEFFNLKDFTDFYLL